MSEYAIIFQVLGAVVALFVIFLTYMSAKSWRWVHVTFMFLTFVASFVFCIYAAMVLKTRAKWVKEHDTLEAQLTKTNEDIERTTRGDPKDIEGKTPSLIGLRDEIERITLDRGRVWRGCTVQGVNRQALAEVPPRVIVSLQTSPPPDPNNPAAGAPKKNNLQPKTVLHAFREVQKTPESPVVPMAYLGEFRVAANPAPTETTVTIESTMPLSPEQIQSAGAQGTWALYETCPVDGHEWITGTAQERAQALSDAANASAERIAPEVANRLIEAYARDGGEADETKDPPENRWYRVVFDQEYEVTVDAPIVNSIDTDPFNTEGQAVLRRLRRATAPEESGKVMFGPKADQINWAVVDQQTAQSLVDRGIAKIDGKPIYRRNLTDYERRFHAINERTAELTDRMRQLDLDNKATIASTQKAEQQRVQVEELKAKVTADLEKVKYEVAQIEKYTAALNGRLSSVQTELSQLYQSNRAISQELNELTARLTEDINRRTRQATARNP
jgi:hypothetical protein